MSDEIIESAIAAEVVALKTKFENLKLQTEEFVTSAKHLSESGVSGAKEILDSAKENWHTILTSFGGGKLTSLFTAAKKVSKKKVAKKAAGKAKKLVKKGAKKLKKASKKKR